MKWFAVLRGSALSGLALGTVLVSALFGSAVDDDSQSDCPEDQCIPFDSLYQPCTELEFRRPELPDFPPETGAEWMTDSNGEPVVEARERDNGSGDELMAQPEVSTDGESSTVCLYNVGYVTDSQHRLYDLFPWACIEVYVRYQYRYKVTKYVYRTLTDPDGSSQRVLDRTYVAWHEAWAQTCVSQICPCPPDSSDEPKSE